MNIQFGQTLWLDLDIPMNIMTSRRDVTLKTLVVVDYSKEVSKMLDKL